MISEKEEIKKKVYSFKNFELPSEDKLMEEFDSAIDLLKKENELYRPLNEDGMSGGLLDFSHNQKDVIIIPDIHGRYEFLLSLMDFIIPRSKKNVLDALFNNEILIVCVGDGVHGEKRAAERWITSYNLWNEGNILNDSMNEEMRENLATVFLIMELKKNFPENFHFLKGNHENIMNENGNGNYAFKKYVAEGQMCREYIETKYSEASLHLINEWEKSLPLCAVFSSFGISHAEPAEGYTREEVINASKYPDVILGLTWTSNDEAPEGSIRELFYNLNPDANRIQPLWFGGHRPVEGKYNLRQKGKYIQLHNPGEMNFALVEYSKKFNPDKNIFSLI